MKPVILGFGNLIVDVIKKDKCTLCGACSAVCPMGVVEIEEEPKLKGKCVLCGICYDMCPRTIDETTEIVTRFLAPPIYDEFLGGYREIVSARTKIDEIAKFAQDGGVVTSLLAYMIDKGIIDGAVLTIADNSWQAKPIVATSREEVIKCAGTKYTVSPNLYAIREAVYDKGLSKIVVVGTPCQITAVRKMQLHPTISDVGSRIFMTIGLFCMESFDYKALVDDFIVKQKGLKIEEIGKFMITKGKLILLSKEGKELLSVPLKEVKKAARKACEFCQDFTSELADISVGSVGSPEGWSSVIIRSELGEKIFKRAVEEGYIEYKSIEEVKPGKDAIIKLSKRKKASKEG